MGTQQSPHTPTGCLVNGSLILCQVFFGLGSVITALGLPASNPFAFGLYREIAAGLILLVAAHETATAITTGSYAQSVHALIHPLRTDLTRFLLLGLFIFGNQAAIVVGVKLSGPVAAAVWQPSQPIMTAAISMLTRREPWHAKRIAGILLATCGCVVMVLLMSKAKQKDENERDDNNLSTFKLLVGNTLFFANCLCTALYVILSKEPLQKHPALLVTAWSYNLAAIFMSTTCFLTSLSPSVIAFLCQDCHSTWIIPSGAIPALLYNIFFNSVLAYGILTWANQYVTGTLVMIFTVLQPVTAAVVTGLLVNMLHLYPKCAEVEDTTKCLDPPSLATVVGMMGVFGGLLLVISTESDMVKQRNKKNGKGRQAESQGTESLLPGKEQALEMA